MLETQITEGSNIIKTCFLYLFELSGGSKNDKDSLKVLFDLLAKKCAPGLNKELTKDQQSQLKIDFASCHFLNGGKQSATALRGFKRFTKLLVGNLIDMYPANKELLPMIVGEICMLSRQKLRLLRSCFTQIAIQFFK